MKRKLFSLLGLLLLFLLLPFSVYIAQQVQQLFSRATGVPADIVVDTRRILESITPSWRSFAQGGEESKDMIKDVIPEMSALKPHYIRLDHLYDHYEVVSRTEGELSFNFSQLDTAVASILSTGAKPLLSLSYMPSVIAQDGTITNPPNDWNEWAQVVQKTVEHYSGRNQKNISTIYYEVWNEPDLFGGWKVYGEKNYGTLYQYAVTGAQRAQNVQPFKIGGPATTALYENWMRALLKYASENNLRVDFLSWHRYATDPKKFSDDLRTITQWSFDYPAYVATEKLITEWGFDPEINPGYDSSFAAAHTVASVKEMLFGYTHLFAFEPVDGPDPSGNEYWGRWGLITHPSFGKKKKPRYTAFSLLNRMQGNRLLLKGEGTWISGFAAQDDSKVIRLILSNYDSNGSHTETVPVTFANLENGVYQIKQTSIPGQNVTLSETVTERTLKKSYLMPKNSVLLLELIRQ